MKYPRNCTVLYVFSSKPKQDGLSFGLSVLLELRSTFCTKMMCAQRQRYFRWEHSSFVRIAIQFLCCYCACEARRCSRRLPTVKSDISSCTWELTKDLRSRNTQCVSTSACIHASSGRTGSFGLRVFWPQGRIDYTIEMIGNQMRQNVPPYFEADKSPVNYCHSLLYY